MKKSKNLSFFSESETKILKILGRKKLSISILTEKFFENKAPLGSNNNVAALIRRINYKCVRFELNWKIEGEGTGRAGRTVWRTYV